jgi:hypothetical protein
MVGETKVDWLEWAMVGETKVDWLQPLPSSEADHRAARMREGVDD